jgi:REP element-mobilizing transposase RayT
MARPLRIDYPDTFYHVLSRGNEKRPIYYEPEDYLKFLELLEKTKEKFHVEIHAYVLMENHYHMLVRTRQGNLSRAIQWLGVTYTGWFNRRHKRSGHLFQGRFKSFLIEDDRYFTAMCYYIHGNPVRAGIVQRVTAYQWSSAKAYADRGACPPWLTTETILGMSRGSRKKFCLEQEAYLKRQESPLQELRHGLYMGGEEYAEECRRLAKTERSPEKPQMRLLQRSLDKRHIAEEILGKLGADAAENRLTARKQQRRSRDLCIYIMSRMGAYTNREIGEHFGVGYTAITGTVKRVEEKYLKGNKRLQRLIDKIIDVL